MSNFRIAAAVSAALGLTAATGAFATGPTPTVANGAAHKIYIAGSSAAASGFINYVENQLCDSTVGWSTFATPTTAANLPDFRAVSCSTSAAAAVFPSSTITVWYRPEGGSAIGVLPVMNNNLIKFLDLGSASVGCTTTSTTLNQVYACTGVTGVATNNGTADSWGGAVTTHVVDIGVSDLEPQVFGTLTSSTTHAVAGGGHHDPFTAYSSALVGATNPTVGNIITNITTTPVFQQVFGFAVHTNLTFTDLPKEQIAAIFDGVLTDWSKVATSGNVAAGSGAIVVCNREVGSGTRASADIFLNGTGCGNVGSNGRIPDSATLGNLQTFAELDCVNTNSNSIGYASIDNLTATKIAATWPSIKAIGVNGVAPTLTNAALGAYKYVYEAAVNENPTDVGTLNDVDTFYGTVSVALQNVNTTSNSAQILAIPGLAAPNTATVPLSHGTVAPNTAVPVSEFTRSANSCTAPTHG